MTTSKIDELREHVAAIGRRQTEYFNIFPDLAIRIESELGEYLGDKTSVALSLAKGDFNFDQGSSHDGGLRLERGKFKIPLMFRLENFHDEGAFLVLIRVFFATGEKVLIAQIENDNPITFTTADLTPLFDGIYEYLVKSLSSSVWFDENPSSYQKTSIGFQRG